MEPRITRQTVRGKLQGNIQLTDHNKEMRKKYAKSLAKKSEKIVSNTSLQSSMVSSSLERKRKCDQKIQEPKAKVAKASVSSIKTTVKKVKQNSKGFSILRRGKKGKGRGRLSTLQHPRLKQTEEIDSKNIKTDSIKPKKTQTAKVRRQQRTLVKVTTLTDNKKIKRQRSEALDLKQSETQTVKSNIQNKSRRRRLPSNVTQFDEIRETTEKTSIIRPYLSFDTNLPSLVSNICCVDQHTLWIGRMAYGSILKVTYNSSNILTIVKEFTHPQCEFYDFCYDRNRDQLLYTDRRNNSIMSISSKYKLKKFKCVKPLKPSCITISPDDFIFLGLVDEYSYQESPTREIVKLATNGTVIMRIPSIYDSIVRFKLPHRIAIQTNNDIVIAANDMFGGEILCFDSEGQSKFKKSVTSPGVHFQPRGLTITRAGDILACNEANGEIYIFDVKGQLLETIKSQSIGISDIPWSLALDNCGHLLIGTMVKYEPNVPTIYFAEYLYR